MSSVYLGRDGRAVIWKSRVFKFWVRSCAYIQAQINAHDYAIQLFLERFGEILHASCGYWGSVSSVDSKQCRLYIKDAYLTILVAALDFRDTYRALGSMSRIYDSALETLLTLVFSSTETINAFLRYMDNGA